MALGRVASKIFVRYLANSKPKVSNKSSFGFKLQKKLILEFHQKYILGIEAESNNSDGCWKQYSFQDTTFVNLISPS